MGLTGKEFEILGGLWIHEGSVRAQEINKGTEVDRG